MDCSNPMIWMLLLASAAGCGPPEFKSVAGGWAAQDLSLRFVQDSKSFEYQHQIKQSNGPDHLTIKVSGSYTGGDAFGNGYQSPILIVSYWNLEDEAGAYTEFTPMQGLYGSYDCASIPKYDAKFCFRKSDRRLGEYDGRDLLTIDDLSGRLVDPLQEQTFRRLAPNE